MIGEVVETSASFEARFRATTLPDHEIERLFFGHCRMDTDHGSQIVEYN
jgi:hypothetical protein